MEKTFVLAQATHIGQDQALFKKNCMDAATCRSIVIGDVRVLIGIVCDGMSSAKNSEVGAKLGIRFIYNTIVEALTTAEYEGYYIEHPEEIPQYVYERLMLWMIDLIKIQAEPKWEDFLFEYLMFTVHAFIVTPTKTVIFRAGDGIKVVNGEYVVYKSKQNKPKYLAYNLLPDGHPEKLEGVLDHFVQYVLWTSQVDSLLLATDGLKNYAEILHQRFCKESITTDFFLQQALNILYGENSIIDDSGIVLYRKLRGGRPK